MLLSAEKISLIKGTQQILEDVSITIQANDFMTIIGPNGAGKSILLKCLMGFEKISSGKISRKQGLKIGYMPQKLYTDFTLPISVDYFIRLGKRGADRQNTQDIIEKTDISDLLSKQLHMLSGGQMQRVLLARSLVQNPDLLILDEPAQNLDITGQLAFYKLLDQIYHTHKLAIMMVSHDLHMVMASTKQVICMQKHICCSGSPHLITQNPEFIRLFGQDMAQMMGIYQHNHAKGCDHAPL